MVFEKKVEQQDFTLFELGRDSAGLDPCQAYSDSFMHFFEIEQQAHGSASSAISPKKPCSHCYRLCSKAIDPQGNVESAGCYYFFKNSQSSLSATIDSFGNFDWL
eukprot:745654-Hanusia_phi.AAC.2